MCPSKWSLEPQVQRNGQRWARRAVGLPASTEVVAGHPVADLASLGRWQAATAWMRPPKRRLKRIGNGMALSMLQDGGVEFRPFQSDLENPISGTAGCAGRLMDSGASLYAQRICSTCGTNSARVAAGPGMVVNLALGTTR